jgi:hypothetical protein
LREKDLAQAKSEIWELWKKVNVDIDRFPAVETDSFSIHSWDLVGEDPMPFYYIQKGEGIGKLPFFLNLHGSGPKDMELRNTMGWSMKYEDGPSRYFVPQIPSERRYRWWLKPVQYAWERMLRLAMIDDRIDPNKIYITGISEGGYGSQRLGAYYADYLAGVGPMAGGEPLRNAPPINYRYVAFSLQTGEQDHMFGRNTLTLAARDTFDHLAAQFPGDFVHQILLQPERGHGIDYTTTTPWLVKHIRNPHPKQLQWVHFPMDGRYRKAFYNIAFRQAVPFEEGDTMDRLIFDIRYEGNDIYIDLQRTDADLKERLRYNDVGISIFLDESFIDLQKKVNVIFNGTQVYNKKVHLDRSHLIESCALFGDPERLFPIRVDL